ncbi:MAG TPA: T9SS type A sorting domain-containing protein [Bacteroidia bacterium]|nr:T9SS type A sorting domain-containing protein [Bacteroidia bacterium]
MKYIFTSLLFICGVRFASAQLTQANHAPANGDGYSEYQCDSTGITLGGTGAGTVWNYTAVPTHSNIVRLFSAVTSTNGTYPSANVFLSSNTGNTAYYNSTTNKLDYYGGNVNVGTVVASMIYTAPVLAANYPMSLNTTTMSTTGGTINFTSPLTIGGTFTGNSIVTVDATGTINLPGSVTYTNVYRVITSQTVNFVTAIASGTLVQVNYEYFGENVKSPVFAISTATAYALGVTTQTIVTRFKASTVPVGIQSQEFNSSAQTLFPNPASGYFELSGLNGTESSVSLCDLSGKQVWHSEINGAYKRMDVSGLEKGLYIFTILDKSGSAVRKGKLLLN